MRLIHTADIHLDRSYASEGFSPHLGTRQRQGLRDALRRILERAVAWPADAVLIAGDLFESDHVSRETVAYLQEQFALLAPTAVVIAPGNHDPFVDDSPYCTEPWPDNVHIFDEARWSAIPLLDGRLVVHGFAFDGPEISRNPFGELLVPDDGAIHVALAHGSEVNHLPAGQKLYCPFNAKDSLPEGLRYAALGHYHETIAIEGLAGVKAWYSGSPEPQSFGDGRLHHYLEVELHEDDAVVSPAACSETRYLSMTIDCAGAASAQDILTAMEQTGEDDGQHTLLRLVLTGGCEPALWPDLNALRDALQSRYEHVDLIDRTEPLENYGLLGRENTSLGGFIAAINDEIGTTPAGARRQMLLRARDAGLAAFRGWELPIRGLGGE